MNLEEETMEESIKKKVNRIGLAGQVISIILIILMAVMCFVCLLGGVTLAVLPDDAVTIGATADMDILVGKGLIGKYMDQIPDDPTELDAAMSVNGKDYKNLTMEKTESGLVIRAGAVRMEYRIKRLMSAVFSGLVYCAAMLIIFIYLKRLSDGFRHCNTPFSDDVIHRMTAFAWALLIGSVVAGVAEAVGNAMINRTLDLSFSLNPAEFNHGFQISFRFAPILIALIVLFLTIIFRYGARLQKEADETL